MEIRFLEINDAFYNITFVQTVSPVREDKFKIEFNNGKHIEFKGDETCDAKNKRKIIMEWMFYKTSPVLKIN